MISKRVLVGLLAGLLGGLISLAIWALGGWEDWEAGTYDWRARQLASSHPPDERIVVVLVDQKSLDWASEVNGIGWPWPRQLYGAIADFCRRGGAASIGFDILFTEPSFYGGDDDDMFAASLAAHPGTVVAAFLSREPDRPGPLPPSLPPDRLQIEGLGNWLKSNGPATTTFPGATLPIEKFRESAAMLANVQISPDPDGVFRRLPLFGFYRGRGLPALGLGARLAADPEATCRVETSGMQVAKVAVPTDEAGRALLRFRGPSATHRTFSAAAVIQSELRIINNEPSGPLAPSVFRDKIVLVGFSAPGLMDLRSSPVASVYPGVEIHATLADNLLNGDFIRLPAGSTIIMLVLGFGLFSGLAILAANGWRLIAMAIVMLASLPVAAGFAGYARGLWLPIVALEAALLISTVGALTGRYVLEGKQKKFIKNAFSQYLSPVFIEELIRNPERLKLGGERRVISIFFSDLQGFTSLSEQMDPENLTAFLNHYLSAMTDIIHEEGGTVDKYEGDAIIAFWNAPLDLEDHAVRAVRAGLRCLARLEEIQPELGRWVDREVKMRIGINTGPAVVGNMGSHDRFDYTMLGDAVNLAARLEGVNKQFGTWILVSENTLREIGGTIPAREVARVTVVGRGEPVTIHEPLSPGDKERRAGDLEEFAEGLHLFYEGDLRAAARTFGAIADRDPAARAYQARCLEMAEATPADWNGVWRVTEKG